MKIYVKVLSLLLLVLPVTSCSSASMKEKAGESRRVVRFAHFTDIHMEPKRNAPEGLKTALAHMQSLADKPAFLITGGDHVMDSMDVNGEWTQTQYDTVKQIFAEYCHIPIYYCIGNHDVWGWGKEKSETTGDEPYWGKAKPVHEFKMPKRYYSFSKGPWQIIILDSVRSENGHYSAGLDDEQFQWLGKELSQNKDKHVAIVSHIPILSAAALLDGHNEKDGQWKLPRQWIHMDARKIKDLFNDHPNVKLCISGHLHLVEQLEYNHVWYVCDGAICAAWWGGNHMECDEGYGVFDLYDDGTFVYQYLSYGWEVPSK